ncbi:hypothetical protein LINPERHAP1_LOCUS17157, partial [Linum perenne]
MMKKEREDELELFKELHKREKDRASSLLQPISSDEFDANHSFYRFPSTKKDGSHPNYDFFSAASSNGKSDYDWLKTPPATPLFPSLEMETTGPPSLLLQREITIVQPLSRLSGSSMAMKNKNTSDRTTSTSTSTTPDRGVAAKSPSTSTSTSRPNIPTGASFRHFAQRTSPPTLNLNTNNTAPASVKNNIVTSSTAAVATEPTPVESQGKPTSSNHLQNPAALPTTGIHSLRDPTPTTTTTTCSSRNGIGKSTKTLPQQSRRSSSSTRPAGLTTSHHDVADHPPQPPPMRLVDRASSTSRVRPPGIGSHQNQTKASTSSNSVTTTKPRRHSVTRSSIITSNTTPPTATRQSTTKTTTSPSSSYSNRQKFHTSTTKTNNGTSGSSTSTSTSNKQIFGSKMVDKVISARKAASGSDHQSKPAAPNSPGLGFGRISAPRNM